MNMNHSHTRQTSGFLSQAALELITAEMCHVGKTNCGSDMQTVTYCRLSSLLFPSTVVFLFLPWGGDGRFLQGKSNNLSHRQTSLHVENCRTRTIQAIFLVIVRKIVSWEASKCSYALPLTGSAWNRRSFGCRLVLFLLIHFFLTQLLPLVDLLPPECPSDCGLIDPLWLCKNWMPLWEVSICR